MPDIISAASQGNWLLVSFALLLSALYVAKKVFDYFITGQVVPRVYYDRVISEAEQKAKRDATRIAMLEEIIKSKDEIIFKAQENSGRLIALQEELKRRDDRDKRYGNDAPTTV